MRYILGIDFGHGETAASYMAIPENDQDQEKLNKIGNEIESAQICKHTRSDGRKIPSVIMRNKYGNYSINLENGALIISFKDLVDPSIDDTTSIDDLIDDVKKQKIINQRAFKAFIREVYQRIVNHHNDIFEKDGSNIDLFIASPTKWTDEEKSLYRQFVVEATGHAVNWVINESDAAYFNKKSEGVVLVVDYGSSTIDYTLMVDGEKKDIDILSNSLGASAIEDGLFNRYRLTEQYIKNKEEFQKKMHETGDEHIVIESFLKYGIRKEKENAYSNSLPVIRGGLYTEDIRPSSNNSFLFRFPDFETLIDDYKQEVKNSFRELKKKIDKIIPNRSIDKIILSGGASIMPWVSDSLKEVFDIESLSDSNPSYVVAEGIVSYAYALQKCKDDVLKVFDSWLKNNESVFRAEINSVIEEQVKRALQFGVEVVLDEYIEDNVNTSYRCLANAIEKYLIKIKGQESLKKQISNNISKLLVNYIKNLTNEILSKYFDLQADCSITLCNLPIVVDTENMGSFITSLKTCGKIDNFRNKEARIWIVDKLKKHIQAGGTFPVTGSLENPENEFESIIEQVRDSLKLWVEKNQPFFVVK